MNNNSSGQFFSINDVVIVEEHGCGYAFEDGSFWSCPLFEDGRIELDKQYCGIVEESPVSRKQKHYEVLRKLGVDNVADVIGRVEYY